MLSKRENQHNGESKRVGKKDKMLNKVQNDSQTSPSTYRRSYYDESQSQIPRPTSSSLLLDPQSGQVIDQVTGKAYWLQPKK